MTTEIDIKSLMDSICDSIPDGFEAEFIEPGDPDNYDDFIAIYAGTQDTGWHIALMDAGYQMQIRHHDKAARRLRTYETAAAHVFRSFATCADNLARHLREWQQSVNQTCISS